MESANTFMVALDSARIRIMPNDEDCRETTKAQVSLDPKNRRSIAPACHSTSCSAAVAFFKAEKQVSR